MAICSFCGKKAGFFSDAHPECIERADTGKKQLAAKISTYIQAGKNLDEFTDELQQIAEQYAVPPAIRRVALLDAASQVISDIATAKPIPEEDFLRYKRIMDGLGAKENIDEMKRRKWFGSIRAAMSCNLWIVLNGELPYYDGAGQMQFNLQRNEVPVHDTPHVVLAEQMTVSHPRFWNGLSVPLGAGLYYHLGASEMSTQQTGLVHIDDGAMLLTTHALYFGGLKETFRIPYTSVIRYEPFSDGVGIFQNAGKPRVFIPDYSGLDTGWFFFNLLTALTKRLQN